MNYLIFTEDRVGTPITEEERVKLVEELEYVRSLKVDEEWIAKDIQTNIDLFGIADRDFTIFCLQCHEDILILTLDRGIVIC